MPGLRRIVLLAVFILVPLRFYSQETNMSSAARGRSRDIFGYDPTADFLAYDPRYGERHAKYANELRALQLELVRQSEQGRATPCSRQLFLEARWLVYYSAHWNEIEKRLADLREMLARPKDPPEAREQVESGGSYDHCSSAWFLKLDSTIEEIEARDQKPAMRLKLLDKINSPEKLKEYLDSLLVSDVRKTGIDNRFELNIAITAIERFIVGHVGRVYDFQAGLKEALFAYEDTKWQDPKTGFWGGWYRLADGTIRKTADLSVTFHIASYRRENLKHVREMMGTLVAMKDEEYPFGWLEEGRKSNHHNYDVVRLFRIGRKEMNGQQREAARAEMREMMDFCLRETLNEDGSFKMMDEDTLGSSFLFPISVLNELGYFRPSLRFWTWESFPDAMKVADRVEHRIKAMNLTDTESLKVLRRFDEARRERRGWLLAGIAICIGLGWMSWRICGRTMRRRVPRAVDAKTS